jgi:hypothetical protein
VLLEVFYPRVAPREAPFYQDSSPHTSSLESITEDPNHYERAAQNTAYPSEAISSSWSWEISKVCGTCLAIESDSLFLYIIRSQQRSTTLQTVPTSDG